MDLLRDNRHIAHAEHVTRHAVEESTVTGFQTHIAHRPQQATGIVSDIARGDVEIASGHDRDGVGEITVCIHGQIANRFHLGAIGKVAVRGERHRASGVDILVIGVEGQAVVDAKREIASGLKNTGRVVQAGESQLQIPVGGDGGVGIVLQVFGRNSNIRARNDCFSGVFDVACLNIQRGRFCPCEHGFIAVVKGVLHVQRQVVIRRDNGRATLVGHIL